MTKYLPTPETLRKLLRYEPDTGRLFWLTRDASMFEHKTYTAEQNCAKWNRCYAGREAFTTTNSCGYKKGTIFGKWYTAHRVAWAIQYGKWPEQQIDHKNGVRHDNRIKNLRDVSGSENRRNSRKQSNNTSGVCGVHFNKQQKKWQAYIKIDYKLLPLGYFENMQDAINSRKKAEIKFGFTKRHGE